VSRLYTVEFENVTVTTAGGDADLFELDAATDKPIEVVGMKIYTVSELQEAQEEWIRLRWIRGHTTSGSTPNSTPTPRPVSPNDVAAGFTCEAYNTTIASAGTALNLESLAFNVRAGYEFFYPENMGPQTSGADLLVLRMLSTLADDVSMTATLWVQESV
jgi:hypothetical protein